MKFTYGPGVCNDTQIIDRMARDNYNSNTFEGTALLVGLAAATTIMETILFHQTGHPPIWTIATVSPMLAITAAVFRTIRKHQQTPQINGTPT